MTIQNLTLNKHEIAIFPIDFFTKDIAGLLDEIKLEIPEFNEGLSIPIPVPETAPREIPRIMLKSIDGSISGSFSFEKINISWNNLPQQSEYGIQTTQRDRIVNKIIKIIFNRGTQKIKRIGYIKEFIAEVDNPIEVVSNPLINLEGEPELRDFMLNMTYKPNLSSYGNCNEVITISNGLSRLDNTKKLIVIMSDTNTRQEDTVNWGKTEIKNFITEMDNRVTVQGLISRFLNND